MKISIITVVKNGINSIEQCIKSVLDQKDCDVEYIIIDGASTDGTMELIERYRNQIDVVISEADDGLYYAMNKGISIATGDVIGILNADDWYERDTLRTVRAYLDADKNIDVFCGAIRFVEENEVLKSEENRDIQTLWYRMTINHPATFVRKSAYQKFGMFDCEYAIAADYELMMRFYQSGAIFSFSNQIFTNFRMGGVSVKKKNLCQMEKNQIIDRYLNDDIMNQLLSELVDTKSVYVFGAGEWGQRFIRILKRIGKKPMGCIDNNKELWDTKIEGIKVLSSDNVQNVYGVILIAVMNHETEIIEQIQSQKNEEVQIVCGTKIIDYYSKWFANRSL